MEKSNRSDWIQGLSIVFLLGALAFAIYYFVGTDTLTAQAEEVSDLSATILVSATESTSSWFDFGEDSVTAEPEIESVINSDEKETQDAS
jgi:hypothetical protein